VAEAKEAAEVHKTEDMEIRYYETTERFNLVEKDMELSKLTRKDSCSLLVT
jgi:hypothetical protein